MIINTSNDPPGESVVSDVRCPSELGGLISSEQSGSNSMLIPYVPIKIVYNPTTCNPPATVVEPPECTGASVLYGPFLLEEDYNTGWV
jgi:hypothetical protein